MRCLSVCPFPAQGSCPDCILWKTPWDRSLGGYLATGGKKDTGLASRMRVEATWEKKNPLFSFMNYLDCEYYNTDLKTHMNTNWYLRLGHGNLMTPLVNVDRGSSSVLIATVKSAKSNGNLLTVGNTANTTGRSIKYWYVRMKCVTYLNYSDVKQHFWKEIDFHCLPYPLLLWQLNTPVKWFWFCQVYQQLFWAMFLMAQLLQINILGSNYFANWFLLVNC